MSRLQSVLDILMQVRTKGLGQLGSAAGAYLKLGNAATQNAKAHKDWNKAMQATALTMTQVASSGKSVERTELELLRLETQMTRITQQRSRALREKYVAQAQLAQAEGNYAKAEELLAKAINATNASMAQRARLQKMMLGVGTARAGSMDKSGTRATTEALAEARLARIRGDAAREMAIYTKALDRNDLSLKNRQRLLVAVAQAEARAAAEARRHAKEILNMDGAWAKARTQLGAFGTSFRNFTRLLGSAVLIGFTIRTVFRALEGVTVRPMKALFTETVSVTDEFRRLEVSLSGITGSLRSARELTKDIGKAAQGLPITQLQAIQGIRGLAYTPATASVLLQQNEQKRQEGLRDILSILTSLATIDPEQGIAGAQFAMREALSGEFRSLRFRFEVSPQVIAQSIGKNLSDLKADPTLVIPALRKFTETFVGPETIAEFSNLLSVQGNLFKGVLEEFFHLIGESGIYDKARNFLRNATRAIGAELHGGPGGGPTATATGAASKISQSLERVMDILIATVEQVIDSLFGVKISLTDLERGDMQKFATALTDIVHALGEFTATLFITAAHIADVLGDWGKFFGVSLGPRSLEEALASRAVKQEEMRGHQIYESLKARIATNQRLLDTAEQYGPGDRQGPKMPGMNRSSTARYDFPNRYFDATWDWMERTRTLKESIAEDESRVYAGYAFKNFDIEGAKETMARLERDIAIWQRFSTAVNSQPDPLAQIMGDTVSDAGEIRQQITLRGRLFTQGLGSGGGDEGSGLITSGFLQLRNRVADLQQAGDDTIAGLLVGLGQKIASTEDAVRKIEQMPQDSRTATALGQLDKQLTSLRDLQAHALDPFTAAIGEQIRELSGGLAAGLQDAPESFRVKNFLSFLDSYNALLSTTGDLSAITASTAAQAQAQFQLLQGKLPAEFRGGATSVLPILQGMRPGMTTDITLGPQEFKMMAHGIRQVVNDLEDTPEKFAPIKEQLNSTLSLWLEGLNKSRDVLTGRIQMSQMLPGMEAAGLPTLGLLPDGFNVDAAITSVNELDYSIAVLDELLKDVNDSAGSVGKQLQEIFGEAAQSISQTLNAGLVDSTMEAFRNMGDGISEILGNVVDSVSRAVMQAIFEMAIIRTFVNPLLNNVFGLTGQSSLPIFGGGSAMGNAFSGGNIIPFAKGGIVNRPTLFGMSGNRMGLMGEAAPEVILPLQRDGMGFMGVGSSGGRSVIVHNNFYFNNTDENGFRKARRHIAADMKKSADRAYATS